MESVLRIYSYAMAKNGDAIGGWPKAGSNLDLCCKCFIAPLRSGVKTSLFWLTPYTRQLNFNSGKIERGQPGDPGIFSWGMIDLETSGNREAPLSMSL